MGRETHPGKAFQFRIFLIPGRPHCRNNLGSVFGWINSDQPAAEF
jgi:hypothetical protein